MVDDDTEREAKKFRGMKKMLKSGSESERLVFTIVLLLLNVLCYAWNNRSTFDAIITSLKMKILNYGTRPVSMDMELL